MKCINCKDQRVVWSKDKFGIMKAEPCPICNKGGQSVREEMNKIEARKRGYRL